VSFYYDRRHPPCSYFDRYVFDEKATADAHDEDGYFRTGDICRRDGPYYFILGRASLDIIKSGGYKISALDIERECLELDYVAEALVVGVEDDEFGQRVGAIISLNPDHKTYSARPKGRLLTINDLRADLRKKLPGYKLPTLLRVVDGELPKGPTGKLQKKILGPQYFRSPGWQDDVDVQAWSREPAKIMAKL
jgi:malonyl-CoA/methylmalonyl-CoA synthetase